MRAPGYRYPTSEVVDKVDKKRQHRRLVPFRCAGRSTSAFVFGGIRLCVSFPLQRRGHRGIVTCYPQVARFTRQLHASASVGGSSLLQSRKLRSRMIWARPRRYRLRTPLLGRSSSATIGCPIYRLSYSYRHPPATRACVRFIVHIRLDWLLIRSRSSSKRLRSS